jgi:hypothetical protein
VTAQSSTSVPRRFRHPIDAPDPKTDRQYRRYLRPGAAAPLREQVDHLAAALRQGDPLADAFVEAAEPLGRARAMELVEIALERGVGAVPDGDGRIKPLFDLFAQLESVPLWVDPEALDLGCRTFRRTGPAASIVLSGFSLMGGYRSSAVVKPLIRTGKLRYMASRRLLDTGLFVLAVTEPGGLGRGQDGYKAAVRVRLLHATIRRALLRAPDWDLDAWGVPINQADMLGTNLLFSTGFLSGCRSLGLRFSREEAHGVVHLWRYVGHLLGIDESLLPANENEAGRSFYLVSASQPPPDADSVALAQALHREPMERAATERQRRAAEIEMSLRASFSRLMLGDDAADELGLPRSRSRYGVRALVALISAWERGRASTRLGTELAYRMGDRWLRRAMALRSQDFRGQGAPR